MDVLLAKLVAHTDRKLKYRQAADNPLKSVAPDRPFPTEKDAADWLSLATIGVPAPSMTSSLAHTRSWSRHIPGLRGSGPPVPTPISATASSRSSQPGACELTGWQNAGELQVLAAACAEAGDFESADKWQYRALTLIVEPADVESCQERLALYRARKTFRQP